VGALSVSDRRTRNGIAIAEVAEAEGLLGLPGTAFPAQLEAQRAVGRSALVACEGNRYSVAPGLAGQTVTARLGELHLEILTPETPSDPWLRQLRARLFQRIVSKVTIDDSGSGPITVTIEGPLIPEAAPPPPFGRDRTGGRFAAVAITHCAASAGRLIRSEAQQQDRLPVGESVRGSRTRVADMGRVRAAVAHECRHLSRQGPWRLE